MEIEDSVAEIYARSLRIYMARDPGWEHQVPVLQRLIDILAPQPARGHADIQPTEPDK